MKRTFLFLFGCLSILTPVPGQTGEEQKWLNDLGSSNFEERVSTTNAIWAKGDEAVPFLEKLIEGEDPELASRANSILRKIRLGITPETPEKIALLIDGYFESNRNGRIAIIEKLVAAQEYDFVLKLRKQEEDANVLRRIDSEIAEIMPRIVARQLQADEIERAKEYLLLSDQFDHLIHYGSLLEYTGELDQEIAKLRENTPGENDARYLACLRVKGDPALLREEALRLGDEDTADLAAIVMGDHRPHFESLLKTGDLPLSHRHYLKWSLAEGSGDSNAAAKSYEAIVHLSKQKSEKGAAWVALFKMGRGDVVIESLGETELTSAIDFALATENYGRAQELMGLPDGGEVVEWIKKTAVKAEEELAQSSDSPSRELLQIATVFLEGRGHLDHASQCALALFDLGRSNENADLIDIASGISYGAPISTITAIAREIDDFEANLEDFSDKLGFLSTIRSTLRGPFRISWADECLWLDSLHEQLYEDMGTRERLLLSISFCYRRLLVPAETFTKARDKVIAHIVSGEDKEAGLQNLRELLKIRNREQDLLMVAEAFRKAGVPIPNFEADLAVDRGRFEDAAQRIQEMGDDPDFTSLEYSPYFLLKGFIMKKEGLKEGDEILEKARRYSTGSAVLLNVFAEQHLRFGEVRQAHELMKKALLRTNGGPSQSFRYWARAEMIDSLAASSAQLGEWREALAYRELKVSNYNARNFFQGGYAQSYRLQLLVARGAVAMEEGNLVKAVESFTRAHRMLPGDGYLANELFPVVRQLGLIELHDQLFAESAQFCRENIRRYPKDDNVYNNFAWLAARANRALDEAEEYLRKALEMNPHSAAYLDTMGEIYFARKNRAEAIKWSEKSLENDILGSPGSRWELQYQHRRFKSGAFPVQ